MHLLPLLFLLPLAVSGSKLSCFNACEESFDSIAFAGVGSGTDDNDWWISHCQNPLRMQSLWICMRQHCSFRDVQAGYEYWNAYCTEYSPGPMLTPSIITNWTDEDIQNLRSINVTESLDAVDVVSEVLVASPELFETAKKTGDSWDWEWNTHTMYGYAMVTFWAIVIAIGVTSQVAGWIASKIARPTIDVEGQSSGNVKSSMWAKAQSWTLQHIIYPPAFVFKNNKYGTVPPVIQSFTIWSFALINVLLCCVNYRVYDESMYWTTNENLQLWRFIADRTAIVATANVPFIWAFATRNNVLLWLTGWSFATFNSFHRWVAFLATLEAMVHSITWTAYYLIEGGTAEFYPAWSEQWFYCGEIATIVMCLILPFSLDKLRKRMYELFLYLHISLALVFLITLWYHVQVYDGEYNGWIWASVGIWVFDRVLRIGRIMILNIFTPRSKAIGTYDADSNIIRLTVPTSSLLKPRGGSFYYIYVLQGYKFYESHPFTLSTWHVPVKSLEAGQPHDDSRPQDGSSEVKEAQVESSTSSNSSDMALPTETTSDNSTQNRPALSFILRPYDSFTARLRNRIVSNGGSTQLTVLVEGPYGKSHDLTPYPSCLFIMGGSGITVGLSYISELFRAPPPSKQGNSSSSSAAPRPRQSIHLVWAVRYRDIFDEVLTQDMEDWFRASHLASSSSSSSSPDGTPSTVPDLRMSLYITGLTATKTAVDVGTEISTKDLVEEVAINVERKESIASLAAAARISGDHHHHHHHRRSSLASSIAPAPALHDSAAISTLTGRPVIEEVVLEEAMRNPNGNLGVVACGPESMTADVRNAVVTTMREGFGGLRYFEDSFTW